MVGHGLVLSIGLPTVDDIRDVMISHAAPCHHITGDVFIPKTREPVGSCRPSDGAGQLVAWLLHGPHFSSPWEPWSSRGRWSPGIYVLWIQFLLGMQYMCHKDGVIGVRASNRSRGMRKTLWFSLEKRSHMIPYFFQNLEKLKNRSNNSQTLLYTQFLWVNWCATLFPRNPWCSKVLACTFP
jgi:hypothetical protein